MALFRLNLSRRERITLGVILLGLISWVAYLLVEHINRPPSQLQGVIRVRTDQRSLATAIESYYVDHQCYPAMRPLVSLAQNYTGLHKDGSEKLMTTEPGGPGGVAGLTTPVAYVTSLFPDAFANYKGMPFAYYTDGGGWILFSPGPNGVYDLVPERDYDSSIPQPSAHLLATATYDPTNGTVSGGDLWRISQQHAPLK